MPLQQEKFIQQLEGYLSSGEYQQALPLMESILLPMLTELPRALLERVLSHIHTLVFHLEEEGPQTLYKDVLLKLNAPTFGNPDLQIQFYLKASHTYVWLNDFFKALEYASQALWLTKRSSVLIYENEIIEQLNEIDIKVRQSQLINLWEEKLPRELSVLPRGVEPPLGEVLKRVTPLITSALSLQKKESIDALYKAMQPLLDAWLHWAKAWLSVTRQNSLSEFSDTVNTVIPVVELFVAHHQWSLALKVYYEILSSVSHEAKAFDKTEVMTRIATLNDYLQGSSEPSLSKASCAWQDWRESLTECRRDLKEALDSGKDVLTAQAEFTQKIKALLNRIAESIVDCLGDAPPVSSDLHPCGFNLLGLGSLSREDMSAYSDVDIALLIEDEGLRGDPYFQAFIQLFRLNVSLIGEPNGVWVDEGDIKYLTSSKVTERIQLNTPQGLLTHYAPKERDLCFQPEAHAIHRPIEIYANHLGKLLLETYQRLLQEAFQETNKTPYDKPMSLSRVWALDRLKMQMRISAREEAVLHLKEDFIRPLTLWCSDMAMYFDLSLENTSIRALLEKLSNYIHQDFLDQFYRVLSDCQHLRLEQQFSQQQQVDTLSHPTEAQRVAYKRLQTYFIRVAFIMCQLDYLSEAKARFHPLHEYIEARLKGTLLREDAGDEKKGILYPDERAVFKYFIEHLIQQKAPAERHQAIYQRLSKYTTAHQLREDHIHYLREQSTLDRRVIDELETFPDQAGRRISVDHERKRWRDELQKILWPKAKEIPKGRKKLPVIELHSTTEGFCILHPAVVQQLLDQHCIDEQGRIRPKEEHRQKINGRHTVMAVDVTIEGERIQVYLKLFPEMPGMEYFAGEMARRIAGHGAAFVDLVRWRAGNKREYDYPVLISQALIGPRLDTLLTSRMMDTLHEIDPYRAGLLTLFEMMIGSEDAKPDNFVLNIAQKTEEKGVVTLSSFDRERSGYPAILYHGNNIIPLIKNIVFCLDHMAAPIDARTREAFLILDPYLLLNDLLQEAHRMTERIYQLYTPTDVQRIFKGEGVKAFFSRLIKQPLVNFSILPIPLREGFIEECYVKLTWLQMQVRKHADSTYFSLYQGIEPYLGHWYQSLHEHYKTGAERFNEGPRKYYPEESMKGATQIDATPTGLQTAPQTLQTMHGKSVRSDELDKYRDYCVKDAGDKLKRIHDEYRACDHIRAQIEGNNAEGLTALRFLGSVDLVEGILEKIERLSSHFQFRIIAILKEIQKREAQSRGNFSFKSLVLRNNLSLKLEDLAALLSKAYQLFKLDITGCHDVHDINNRLLPLLEKHTPNLEILNLNELSETVLAKEEARQANISFLPESNLLGRERGVFRELTLLGREKTKLPEFNSSGREKAKHANVWFFPELQKLRLNGCKNLKRINIYAPKLKWLEVNECEALSEITLVGSASQLKGLFCRKCTTLKKININAPNLETASFAYCTEISFSELAQFLNQAISSIRRLELKGCSAIEVRQFKNMMDEELQPLLRFLRHDQTSRVIDLSDNELTDASIDALLSLLEVNQTLCEIDVRGNPISEEKEAMLSRVLGPRYARWQLEKMKASTMVITEINWSGKRIADPEVSLLIDVLKANATVREIALSSNHLTDKSIDALLSLLEVNQLLCAIDVSRNPISEEKEAMLSRVLGPRYACWQLEEMKASTTVITKIRWWNKGIGDAEVSLLIDFLKANETVRKIDLSSNHLTDKSIDAFLSLLEVNQTLREIDVGWNSISEEKEAMLSRVLAPRYACWQLEEMKTSTEVITKIDWRYKGIGDPAIEMLTDFLKANETVREIDLSSNHLTDKSIDTLLSLLEVNQTLCEIDVRQNSISKEKEAMLSRVLGPRYACWQLEEMKTSIEVITKIDWRYKGIGDPAIEMLTDFLKANETVREIDLSSNHLTDKSIDTLLSLLEVNQTLCEIDVRQNSISKEKEAMLSRVLGPWQVRRQLEEMKASTTVITEIHWQNKGVGDSEVSLLIASLKANETVREINLSRNQLTDKSIDALLSLLEVNQTLREIAVGGNPISKEKKAMLSRVLGLRQARRQLEEMKASTTVITKINWWNKRMGDAGVSLLIDFLKANETVRGIGLSGNHLTDKSIDALLSLLEVNQTLCKIDVRGNPITKEKEAMLSRVLGLRQARRQFEEMKASTTVVTKFYWWNKGFRDAEVSLLIDFLKDNETVREINLSSNYLTDKSIDALLSLLEVNQTLCKIAVGGNPISKEKEAMLSRVLGPRYVRQQLEEMKASTTVITKIYWGDKGMGDAAVSLLIDFLKANETVREIVLSSNHLTDKSIDALLSLLAVNKTLYMIRLDGNSISKEKEETLSHILNKRRTSSRFFDSPSTDVTSGATKEASELVSSKQLSN